jgi:hypothetical protein
VPPGRKEERKRGGGRKEERERGRKSSEETSYDSEKCSVI